MKKLNILLLLTVVTLAACKTDKKPETASEPLAEAQPEAEQPTDFNALLDASPRHQEWVTLESNGRELYTFVVYPEKADKAKTVIAIHENRGLNDWARYFADQLAAKGYIVLAPDLLSNAADGIKKTTDYKNSDAARDGIYELKPDAVTQDLDAVFTYAQKMDAATGEVAVVGFCWGGSQTFRYATNNPDITEANVFYGTAPEDAEAIKKIKAPVYGYYGGDDNRVNSTIAKTDSIMKKAGLIYETVIYEGAGHAFMRRGAEADSDAANKKAHDAAWVRLLDKLK
ncbi:MAG: carboxymethylenebutenolidase [Cytophagaceae bacterium]|nr:carboxymethylenebutenolidase [Cytophagaceae bacterium]|tara:strand:+ start:1838 stop:2692 length:855 start_codon:yes stop_codon:yes gene_type:complete